MAGERIIVVEDEEDIQELVSFNLAKENYRVKCAGSGREALQMIQKEPPDLVVLDLMLPDVDGLEVCRQMKQDAALSHIPIVMLTAKGEESDIVTGLELGADDYVTKPFSLKVFVTRVRMVLRRRQAVPPDESQPLQFPDLIIHPGRHEVQVKGKVVKLTFSEFQILHCLARRPGWVFTRSQIVDAVRGDDYAVTDRAVDFQIVGLRKKLGKSEEYIETVRGVGYRFKD